MLAVPTLTPVIIGCVAGAVCPAGIVMLAADMVSLEVSVLARDTVTPPAGAGVGNVTGKNTCAPNPTVALDGKPIAPTFTTFTVAVVSASAAALAWITDVPTAMPVTGTVTLVLVAAKVTVVGTVTAAGLLELILTTRPLAGAGPERFSVKSCVPFTPIVRVCCWKLRVAATCTAFVSPKKPGAEALMLADPRLADQKRVLFRSVLRPVHPDREGLLLETEGSCDLYRLRVSEEARGRGADVGRSEIDAADGRLLSGSGRPLRNGHARWRYRYLRSIAAGERDGNTAERRARDQAHGERHGLARTHGDIREQRDGAHHGDGDTRHSGVVSWRSRQDGGGADGCACGRKRRGGGARGECHRGRLEGYEPREIGQRDRHAAGRRRTAEREGPVDRARQPYGPRGQRHRNNRRRHIYRSEERRV